MFPLSSLLVYDVCRHFPSKGHSFFFLQLHSLSVCTCSVLFVDSTFLLCDEIMDFTLGMQE